MRKIDCVGGGAGGRADAVCVIGVTPVLSDAASNGTPPQSGTGATVTAVAITGVVWRPQSHTLAPSEPGPRASGSAESASAQHPCAAGAGSGERMAAQGSPRSHGAHPPGVGRADTRPGSSEATIAKARTFDALLIRIFEQYLDSFHSVNEPSRLREARLTSVLTSCRGRVQMPPNRRGGPFRWKPMNQS